MKSSVADEMEKLLSPNALNKVASDGNLDLALKSLEKAANLFDDAKLYAQADAVTKFISLIPTMLKNKSGK